MESRSGRYSWLIIDPKLQPYRSKTGGALLLAATPILAIIGAWLLFRLTSYFFDLLHQDDRVWYFGLVVGILLFAGAARLAGTAWQLRQDDALDLLKRDPRPPIVYLRSFLEDSRLVSNVPADESVGGERTVKQGEVGLRVLFGFKKRATLEIQLGRILRRVGPFVTIGRPSDVLAPSGAARLYVAHEHWRAAVAGLVRVAGGVVIQPEATEGTWWEVNHATTSMDLRRILMIVPDPSLRPLGFARIQNLTTSVLPIPLPVRPPPCDAFMFDIDFKPRPLAIARNPEAALKPFLDQLRVLGTAQRT